MRTAPITFLFRREAHWLLVWNRVTKFVRKWNESRNTRFIQTDKGDWKATFVNGMRDEEVTILSEELNSRPWLTCDTGVEDLRTAEEFSGCDFVHFECDRMEDHFYVNHAEAVIPETACEKCKVTARFSARLVDMPVVDESFLDHKEFPGLDFIGTPNGATLITKKVKDLLEAFNGKGYAIFPLPGIQKGTFSERLFLLKATLAVLEPCHTHTPRHEGAICPHCSAWQGTVWGDFCVQEVQTGGSDVFAVSRFGIDGLYFSQRLYREFLNAGFREMHVTDGIDVCCRTS